MPGTFTGDQSGYGFTGGGGGAGGTGGTGGVGHGGVGAGGAIGLLGMLGTDVVYLVPSGFVTIAAPFRTVAVSPVL